MARWLSVMLLVLPLALAWTQPALARQRRLSDPLPPGWKLLNNPAGPSTSRCIGRPVTPICAVETALACIYWRKPSLCELVHAPFPPEQDESNSLWVRNDAELYSTMRSESFPVTESRLTPWDERISKELSPTWRIITSESSCDIAINRCYRDFFIRYWYLAHINGQWKVLSIYGIFDRDVPDLKF
jgi:hypothetical protein